MVLMPIKKKYIKIAFWDIIRVQFSENRLEIF